MAIDYDAGQFAIDVVVAVLTLAVTAVAVYEIMAARRERARADARELINVLYAPTRQLLLDLGNVERQFELEKGITPEEGERARDARWSVVSHRVLHLLRQVPKEVAEILRALEQRGEQLERAWPALRNSFEVVSKEEAKRILAGQREGQVQVRILEGDAVVDWVDPRIAWVVRQPFDKWLDDWLLVRGLKPTARVELMVAGYVEGSRSDAERVMASAYARLDQMPAACRFRDEMTALVGLTMTALKLVDEQVALLSG